MLSFVVKANHSFVECDLESGGSIYDLIGWVSLHQRAASNNEKPPGRMTYLDAYDDNDEMYCVDIYLGQDHFDKIAAINAHGNMPTFRIATETDSPAIEMSGAEGWRWLNKQHRWVKLESCGIEFRQGNETDE